MSIIQRIRRLHYQIKTATVGHSTGALLSPRPAVVHGLEPGAVPIAFPSDFTIPGFDDPPPYQDGIPACTVFGEAEQVEMLQMKQHGGPRQRVSRKFMWGNRPTLGLTKNSGSAPSTIDYYICKDGAPPDSMYPGITDVFTAKAGITQAMRDQAPPNRMASTIWMNPQDIDSIRAMILSGRVVGVSIGIYPEWYHPTSTGVIKTPASGFFPTYYHRIAAGGWRTINGALYLFVKNWWGLGFGLKGFGLLPAPGYPLVEASSLVDLAGPDPLPLIPLPAPPPVPAPGLAYQEQTATLNGVVIGYTTVPKDCTINFAVTGKHYVHFLNGTTKMWTLGASFTITATGPQWVTFMGMPIGTTKILCTTNPAATPTGNGNDFSPQK